MKMTDATNGLAGGEGGKNHMKMGDATNGSVGRRTKN